MKETQYNQKRACSLIGIDPRVFRRASSADALIAPWVIKGATDGKAFAAYVE